jgi:hypothetical protein
MSFEMRAIFSVTSITFITTLSNTVSCNDQRSGPIPVIWRGNRAVFTRIIGVGDSQFPSKTTNGMQRRQIAIDFSVRATLLGAASTKGRRVFVAAARSRRLLWGNGRWRERGITPLGAASTEGRRVVAAARSRRLLWGNGRWRERGITPLGAASTEGRRVFVAAARSRRLLWGNGRWRERGITPLGAASTEGRRVFVAAARSRRLLWGNGRCREWGITPLGAASTEGRRVFVAAARSRRLRWGMDVGGSGGSRRWERRLRRGGGFS